MAKLKRGQKLVCVPCAREVVVSSCGVARTTLWCCGRAMKSKSKASKKSKVFKRGKTSKKK